MSVLQVLKQFSKHTKYRKRLTTIGDGFETTASQVALFPIHRFSKNKIVA
jgi:hypothetical protein